MFLLKFTRRKRFTHFGHGLAVLSKIWLFCQDAVKRLSCCSVLYLLLTADFYINTQISDLRSLFRFCPDLSASTNSFMLLHQISNKRVKQTFLMFSSSFEPLHSVVYYLSLLPVFNAPLLKLVPLKNNTRWSEI